jgi:hypothetical protein
MIRRLIGAALLFLAVAQAPALAQSSPGWGYGYVPTAAEWNAAFAAKQDYLGTPACATGGCTMTGELITVLSSTAQSGFNVPPGAAPTSPNNGDLWSTSTGFYFQVNGATAGPVSQDTIFNIQVPPVTVNFNVANTDTLIAIPALPAGYTRYMVTNVVISNASHTLTTATFGVFNAASAGGAALVAAATAITVSSATDGAANNAQATAGVTTVTMTLASFQTIYFRVGTAEGSAATASVSLILRAIP